MMRRREFAATILIACMAGVLPAAAQEYPARDIRILCNFTPGSSADVFVRFYAERLSAATRQNVKVENLVKNGGLEATEAAAKAKPDGYTILITPANATLAAGWHTAKKPKWDPLRDFAAVTTIARFAQVVLVNPRTPIKSIAELTTYVKSRKDDAIYGANPESAGAAALYNKLAGIQPSRVAMTAAAALINDLYAGDADYLVLDIPSVYDQVKAGKLRALAVSSSARSSMLPDVPTMEEAGIKGFGNVERWWGVFAPAKTPQAVLEKLEATFTRIVESEESKKFIANVRAEPFPGDAKSTQALLAAEVKRWGELGKLVE